MDQVLHLNREQSFFTQVLTLSHHSPITIPEDYPEELDQRIEVVLKSFPHLKKHERNRIKTAAYTDFVVSTFMKGLEARGLLQQSLVIISADHATPDIFPWN